MRSVCAMLVGGVLALSVASPPASAAVQPAKAQVSAVWNLVDGCTTSTIIVSGSQAQGGVPSTSVSIYQSQTCTDPSKTQPVLDLTGEYGGGRLRTSSRGAQLVGRVPVRCHASEPGACDRYPSGSTFVSLHLRWRSAGRTVTVDANGLTCTVRYGTVSGSLRVGRQKLLTPPQARATSDVTEDSVWRCD